MQQVSRMLSITIPKRTELSRRRVLSRIESFFFVTTLTAGANAGGLSIFGPTSVSVVAILEFRRGSHDRLQPRRILASADFACQRRAGLTTTRRLTPLSETQPRPDLSPL